MADPVVVGADIGELILLTLGTVGISALVVGIMAYGKIDKFLHGRQLKNEIRQEITDRRQTDLAVQNAKEISEVKRELDKIQTK